MVQAEQSVIGCLMMAPELLDRARAVLSPAMFEAQPLARIFSCMLELKKAGTPVDAVTVVSRLGDGYAAMIRECACIAPRIGTFPQYAAIVLDAWRERTLVTELQSLAISGRTADEMTAELERMAARQRSIMQKVHSASEQTFGEAVAQAYRDLLKPDTSLKTDWKHFNDVLGGLQRGCLYIIAARPGDGKTDFALHLAVQLAKRCRVDYRSLEMTKEQLVHRVLSRVCMINSTRFRDHDLDENAQKRIGIAAARMGDLHLVMDDTPGVSAGDVEAKLASGNDSTANHYAALLAQVQAQQDAAARRAEELARQKQQAAQAAYDKNMGYLNEAYANRSNLLQQNYNDALAQLQASYDSGARGVNQNADSAQQQAYINYMMSKRDLPQALAAQGLTGGMSESALAGMYNSYGNNRNTIDRGRNESLAALLDTLNSNRSSALQSYNSQLSAAEQQKMAYQMQLEQALANGSAEILQNKYDTLQNLDNAYAQQILALQQAAAQAAQKRW